jgi:Outer membrane protein beta-barrel domain
VGALAGEAERMRMIKPLLGLVFTLALTCGSNAQVQGKSSSDNSTPSDVNVATPFATSSASQVNLLEPSANAAQPSTFTIALPANATPADPAAAALPASPAPKPSYIFGDRDDYRWQLGVGVEIIRFQSNIIDSTLVGLNTTVTYFTNDWFGLEGNLVTGFAPEIYTNAHVKYFGGAGGIRIGSRRARFEPFGHVLVGGAHLQPQTAGNSRDSLEVTAGGGLDYRVNARLSLRVEGDWLRTQFFSDSQNNFQGVAAVVFHF